MARNSKSTITRLLEKRGLKIGDLSAEEQADLSRWRETLAKGDIKTKDISDFCQFNLDNIERQFKNLDLTPEKQSRLVLLHSVYSSIRGIINNPQVEKKQLENYLESLL